ncbi:C6 zinc finger protein [Colletotrichum tofieldiae]|nr:C6 zinc finger protein [Colletotrichum tofieldiae]GKT74868.1 C6 zinc finger protein [Colletotrichum tofieldiae]
MVAGHFSRIEYASSGAVPGSLISEFAKIARDYVNKIQQSESRLPDVSRASVAAPAPASQPLQFEIGNKEPACESTDMTLGFSTVSPGILTGTDVMGIFNYFIPDLDPMFYQGKAQDYDMTQNGGLVDLDEWHKK